MTAPALAVTRTDGIAEILLVRPELLNRFDPQLHVELTASLIELARDTSVRVVVLGSTGTAFSAGGDFALMEAAHADPSVRAEILGDAQRLIDAFLGLPQPLVIAAQGVAVGLGATVALLGDILVAARGASLSDTHVHIGLVAGDGGCLVWPQAMGLARARRHLLTGDPLDAETAWQIGVVTDLVDTPVEALPAAHAIARRLARLAPLGVQGTKQAINRGVQARADEVVAVGLALEDATLASDDLLEGIAAFREKRRPAFSGR